MKKPELHNELFGNNILLTDSYKVTHWKQLPPGTTNLYSFFESRGGRFPSTVFYGLQYYLQMYLVGQVVTKEKIAEAKEFFKLHFETDEHFNEAGWNYILEKYDGHLPVKICAVPEGMDVPTHNVLMTAEILDDEAGWLISWLTNYLETVLSMMWYPITVATQSREMKKIIKQNLEKTGDPELLPFKLHDFGFRGSTSVESSAVGGSAHLVNFQGTDTLSAIMLARKIYNEPMAGFSVPAAEHSTITSWERKGELKAYENMLKQFPSGTVAIVIDSYDVYKACRDLLGKELKSEVLERDGVLVLRPDSGDPVEVLLKLFAIAGDAFGYYTNDKGYKVLNDKVRILQGDGIDYEMIIKIYNALEENLWSGDNITFGSGGGLLQKNLDRDTQKFAFKCAAIKVNNVWIDVMKDPITDPGKKSKAGRMKLIHENGTLKTVREEESDLPNILVPVFENGHIVKEYTFTEIRERAELK
ncbi:MAG: nicotinate phosphoribosyltransferase [Candidatus Nomurabacteria bacterium]|nr:nicotinate phosphoribosyltransferase [Candidatus Nomurabacteria bacterium]